MEQSKMTANDAVKLLISCINSDKPSEFYKVAENYLSTLSIGGQNYWQIKRILNQKPTRMKTLDELKPDIKKLISTETERHEYVFIDSYLNKVINEILFEWENKDVYKLHNLNVRNKILLHGPTGNGKTTIARNIAKQSKLPFVEVNSDIMIDSHLGSTGQNIHKLFNTIKEPCILFWDEVDSIGRSRGSSDKSGVGMENERMVNSILVNLEKLSNDVIFIGATNRKDILDVAFIRRFDILHEVGHPTLEMKQEFTTGLFKYHGVPEPEINFSELENFSKIKDVVIRIARQHVIEMLKKSA